MNLKEARAAKSRAQSALLAAQSDIDKALARKMARCNHCGKSQRISRLTYIQTHWYVTPYGCTGGDYWREGEGRFICDLCDYENRLIYRPELVSLKRYFNKVIERFDDEDKVGDKYVKHPGRKWCN